MCCRLRMMVGRGIGEWRVGPLRIVGPRGLIVELRGKGFGGELMGVVRVGVGGSIVVVGDIVVVVAAVGGGGGGDDAEGDEDVEVGDVDVEDTVVVGDTVEDDEDDAVIAVVDEEVEVVADEQYNHEH